MLVNSLTDRDRYFVKKNTRNVPSEFTWIKREKALECKLQSYVMEEWQIVTEYVPADTLKTSSLRSIDFWISKQERYKKKNNTKHTTRAYSNSVFWN